MMTILVRTLSALGNYDTFSLCVTRFFQLCDHAIVKNQLVLKV